MSGEEIILRLQMARRLIVETGLDMWEIQDITDRIDELINDAREAFSIPVEESD